MFQVRCSDLVEKGLQGRVLACEWARKKNKVTKRKVTRSDAENKGEDGAATYRGRGSNHVRRRV